MNLRTHKMSSTVIYGVTLAVFVTVVFFLMNAGIDPRANRYGDVDPASAGVVCFGLFGLYHAIAIIFFDDDDSPAPATKPAEDATTSSAEAAPRQPGSVTAFMRQPAYKVFSVGPIWAAASAAVIFIWFAAADVPGTGGTVWGDYGDSPLPAFAVFFGCWAATNVCFVFSTLAEAGQKSNPPLYIVSLILLFLIGLGVGFGFMFALPKAPPVAATISMGIALLVSLAALAGVRLWAFPRFAREAEEEKLGARSRRRQAWFGSRHQGPGRPPYDMLESGETLLAHFIGDGSPEPQMLVATNRRVVRAMIRPPGRSFAIEQAQPGQLLGAELTWQGRTPATVVHLRGRPGMVVSGGDPATASRFAEALTSLARTGRLPATP